MFEDRLIDDGDQEWLLENMSPILTNEEFGVNSLRGLFFGDFLDADAANPVTLTLTLLTLTLLTLTLTVTRTR